MSKKVVYNHKPDPVTKITEFEIDKPKPKKKVYYEQLKSGKFVKKFFKDN